MPDSQDPKQVSSSDLRNSQFGGGLINADTVNAGRIGGDIYNIHLGQQTVASGNSVQSQNQRQRSLSERDSLEKAYTLQSQKVANLRTALVIETDVTRKFQYEHQLQAEERTLKELGNKLDAIEQQLQTNDNSELVANTTIYIERPPIEDKCYKAIVQPGALIRLKAPQRMGKTLLLEKTLDYARHQGYQTAKLDLQLADIDILANAQQQAKKAEESTIRARQNLIEKSREISKTNEQLIQSKNKESAVLEILNNKENELNKINVKNEDAKAEVANVRKLVELAGKLRNESSSDSDEALRLAALSFNIDNHQLKQALLFSAKSQAYQKLKDWMNARNEIQESQLSLSQTDKNELVSNQGLQIQVLFQKSQGDLLAQDQQYPKAIDSLRVAFNILRVYPTETDFTKENQLLTGENIESVHRGLIKLNPQNKELKKQVEESLKKHLYTQLEYFLKAKNWESANRETDKLMLNIAKRETEGYLDYEQINSFSCDDLRKIDQLWVSNSDNRFGFSVQKKIWISTKNRLGVKPEDWNDLDKENYLQFAKAVGWYDGDTSRFLVGSFVSSNDYYKRIEENSLYGRGGLPIPRMGFGWQWWGEYFFSRVATCKV